MNIYQHKVSIFNKLQITTSEFLIEGERQDMTTIIYFKRHHVINKSIKQIVTYFVCLGNIVCFSFFFDLFIDVLTRNINSGHRTP